MSQQKNDTSNNATDSIGLDSWQQNFYDGLLNELSPKLQQSFTSDASKQRFAIYQNNVFYSLATALGDLYPVVKKLVGDDFFTGTAGVYFRQHPPQKAAMVFLGENFADFLRDFEHTRTMTYLPEIATLELARHRAYNAADKAVLTAETMASVTPDLLAESIIELHPSLQCNQSPEPIFSIWQNNQEESSDPQQEAHKKAISKEEVGKTDAGKKESILLGEPQQVLVVRPVYSIDMYQVPDDIYLFIQCLQQQYTLAGAIENTIDKHADFDVSHSIQFALQTQLFSDIKQP
jgi:hypothetical protein